VIEPCVIVHLVALQSMDKSFKNDPAAHATWCIGVPAITPLFLSSEPMPPR